MASANQPTSSAPTKPETKPFASAGGFGFGSSATATSTGFGASTTSFSAKPASDASSAASQLVGGRIRRKPWPKSKGIAPKVKAWADADVNRPRFTENWEVEYFDTLQWTDVKTNHNKYYCLELHIGKDKGKQVVRLYTHYGRTDDLVKNPKAGRRENRFYNSLEQAEDAYAALIEEKTLTKGYRKVELVFSNIGSDRLRTLISEIASSKSTPSSSTSGKPSAGDNYVDLSPLAPEVAELVKYIYEEAAAALNNTLGPAKITSLGIETPLGVVNLSQIDKGEAILQRLYELFKLGTHDESAVDDLTNQFYTVIPHNLGRNRNQISATRLNSMAAFEEKQDLLQLMRDMLNVTSEGKSLGASDIDMKYRALRSKIEVIAPGNERFEEVKKTVLFSGVDVQDSDSYGSSSSSSSGPALHTASKLMDIKRIYQITRPAERTAFNACRIQTNQRALFHGSRVSNYVGLLSRGLMMPKMVVAMGGKRRDGGLLGNGIYFADSASTSAQYCSAGSRGSRLMLVNNVALGTVYDFEKVAFGLMEPPHGYHSVHGIRSSPSRLTDFKDDEYVIFNPAQQYQSYLVEFEMKVELAEFVTSQLFHNADGSSSVQLKAGALPPVSTATSSAFGASNIASNQLLLGEPKRDEISATVDDIFAGLNIGPSNASTSIAANSSSSTKFGGSYKSKFGATSTFTTPFSSMLTGGSGLASDALKLAPSTLQTTGLLKPSGLGSSFTTTTSGSAASYSSSSTAFGGSLRLQPSGLTTDIKLKPIGTSFGRKSTGTAEGSEPLNAIKFDSDFDPSVQTSSASGAAALLQNPTEARYLTDEEKAARRAAMKAGGKNFGFPVAAAPAPAAQPPSSFSSSPYATDTSAYTAPSAYTADTSAYSAADPYTQEDILPPAHTTQTPSKKRRHSIEEPTAAPEPSKFAAALKHVDLPSSVDLSSESALPHKKPKKLTGSDIDAAKGKTRRSEKSSVSKPSPFSLATPLSATTSANTSTAMASALERFRAPLSASVTGNKTSTSLAPLSSSSIGGSSLGGSSLGLGLSFTSTLGSSFTIGANSAALSGSSLGASQIGAIRTAFTRNTPQAKLITLLPKELLKERLTESKLRALYQSDRTNVLLKDYVHLVEVFKKREIIRYTIETEAEKTMPKVLTRQRAPEPVINAAAPHSPFGAQYDPNTQGSHCIVEDMAEFKKNYDLLSSGILSAIPDSRNLLFLGELVVGALLRSADGNHVGNTESLKNLYRGVPVELAIIGLKEEAVKRKVNDILFAVQNLTKATSEIVRSKDEILIISQFPTPIVRISLRALKGPAEAVFLRSDIDCVGAAFECDKSGSEKIWALPRTIRAWTKRYNLLDETLRHATYEVQLYRWASRGFCVAVPGLQRHLITPHLYQQRPWQVTGLAKLLLFEHEQEFRVPQKTIAIEPWMPRHQRFAIYTRDEFSEMNIHEFQAIEKLTYAEEKDDIDRLEKSHFTNLYVPWGPQWHVSKILKHLKYTNSRFYALTGEHMLLFGANSVLTGSAPTPSRIDLEDSESPSSSKVSITDLDERIWKRVVVPQQPLQLDAPKKTTYDGLRATHEMPAQETITQQPISSSTPISGSSGSGEMKASQSSTNAAVPVPSFNLPLQDYYYEAYTIEGSAVETTHAITDAAFSNDLEALKKFVRKLPRNADVTRPSGFANGRNALIYACAAGNSDAISVVLGKGGAELAVAADPSSGLLPIHFTAYSGDPASVETLLRQPNVDINAKTKNENWTALHFAAYYGHLKVLEVLLQDTKIKMEVRDRAGRTPVFVAAYSGQLRALLMLKAQGAKLDTKAPNEEVGVSAAAIAAQRGHAEVRTYLVDLLRPEFPPALVPASESLFELNVSEGLIPDPSAEHTIEEQSVSTAVVAEWSAIDRYGQNLLHYAVKNAEAGLVQQLVSREIEDRSTSKADIYMPPALSEYNLIDIDYENMFGQTALYYALHLLDSFTGASDKHDSGTIEALGLPQSERASALRSIVDLLKLAGAKKVHLMPHRSLPEGEDEKMKAFMVQKARVARSVLKKLDQERKSREAELQAEEDRAAAKRTPTKLRRRTSNDGSVSPTHRGGSHGGIYGASPSSLRRSGSRSRVNASGSSRGPGFNFQASSATPSTTLAEFASQHDVTQLLSTISQMHKSKVLSESHRTTLKTLALRRDRSVVAALQAFQQDHVSLSFTNSLQLIARMQCFVNKH